MNERIDEALDEAEHKAIDSLARYKFQMFGYWAAIWVHLNRIAGSPRENPFRLLVHAARAARAHKVLARLKVCTKTVDEVRAAVFGEAAP